METFTGARPPSDNPEFDRQKKRAGLSLDFVTIDPPLIEIVTTLNRFPYCFTLQSCYGHFVLGDRTDPRTIEPLPAFGDVGPVEYRIAYVALCVKKSPHGEALLSELESLTEADPHYIQFGCAEWFWERQVNSYVVQVEPDRFKHLDSITISHHEALRIQSARDSLFEGLRMILSNLR